MAGKTGGAKMLFRVLGPLETQVRDEHRRVARKPAALLARLLVSRGEWVDCNQLIEAIWPDRVPPRSALSNIKSYIWQIRHDLLPPHDNGPTIEARAGAYRLCAEPGEVDVECFRRHTAEGRTALAQGDAAGAVHHLEAAAALWRGTPFAELPDELVAPVVAELEELRWEVRESLADALIAVRRHREGIALLRDLTTADPLREGPWARLVMALVRTGRRSEALATYDDARRVLADELGVDPGRELAEAHRHALAEEPATRRARCDLPRDVPDFTGRSREAARLTELSRSAATTVPVVVIDGMPGVGKSALAVHAAHRIAGQFPDGQLFVDLSPDGAPLGADVLLARLLRAAGVRDIPDTVAERAAAWRAHLAGQRVLLVLDGASSSDQVRPLLPGSAGCMVVITARTRVLHLDAIEPMTLTPLPAAQTADLFRSRTGASADVVREVVRRTGGLPAAVRAATALFHARPQWTPAQFAARLGELHAVATMPDGGLDARAADRALEHLVDRVAPALRELTAV